MKGKRLNEVCETTHPHSQIKLNRQEKLNYSVRMKEMAIYYYDK